MPSSAPLTIVQYIQDEYKVEWKVDNTLKDGMLIQGIYRRLNQVRKAHVYTKGMFKEAIPPQEFVVSPLITLKLESMSGIPIISSYNPKGLTTNIYVAGKPFKQCKYLLLDFPKKDKKIKDIDNIDDAMKHYSRKMEHDHTLIPPETEFFGHCSNLQAWYENDYDLRILHSNLSLPLLKELANHDPRAKMRLKEQLAEKVEKGGFNAYTTYRGTIIKHFTVEEIKDLKEFVEFPKPPIVVTRSGGLEWS